MTTNGTKAARIEPGIVHVDPTTIRMAPAAMRALTAATGRTMEQLMASPESADKFQAMAFFEVRRQHPELTPPELWELAGESEVEIGDLGTTDPFGTASSMATPPSLDSGASTPTPSTT